MIKKKDNRAVWRFQQHILYNLTHPDRSVQLLAPLAKTAGGYGACREIIKTRNKGDKVPNKPASGFASKDDPAYRTLLAAIQDAKALHDSDPRWDSPGWKAPVEYIREMKRHGILPESFDREKDPLDPHEIDRRYWHAVTGHHLPGKEPKLHANPTIRAMCMKGTLTPSGEAFKPDSASLTTGKPSACSKAIAGHPAALANDGIANDTNSYWAMDVAGGIPAWWRVDFEKPTDVGRIVVIGYFGDRRIYGFTIETSVDGKKWDTVADMRKNKTPSTPKGYTCKFQPRKVRYIKITQTSNSANTGRHLVEVMAFEK